MATLYDATPQILCPRATEIPEEPMRSFREVCGSGAKKGVFLPCRRAVEASAGMDAEAPVTWQGHPRPTEKPDGPIMSGSDKCVSHQNRS